MPRTEWGKSLTKLINAAEKATKSGQEVWDAIQELKAQFKKGKPDQQAP